MKILSAHIENYMGVKIATITPDSSVVLITGANGQGKTSAINAIWAALAGGDASRAIKQQVREGEKQASVRLDLGDYIVTRRWLKNGVGELTVETPHGAEYQKPQGVLDNLMSKLAMDPLAFTKLDAPKQVAALIKALGDTLSIDPVALEVERVEADALRAAMNKAVKQTTLLIDAHPDYPADTPKLEGLASELLKDLDAAVEHNAERADVLEGLKDIAEKIGRAQQRARDAQAEITGLLEEEKESTRELETLGDAVDVEPIRVNIAGVDERNRVIRGLIDYRALVAKKELQEAEAKGYDDKLKAIAKKKADGLAAAVFPDDRLGFGEDGVLLNGRPFGQASTSEQLIASLKLAAAENPELRVIRADKGESLDKAGFAVLEQWADENDYQVWVTKVDESGTTGVVFSEGEIVK